MDCVFNIAGMEEVRAANEAAMSAQMEEMERTRTEYIRQAEALERAAEHQDHIAATAMMAVTRYDSDGDSYTEWVPDTAARAAARRNASELRSQASALRGSAQALAASISMLQTTINSTNSYMRALMEAVQQTDLTFGRMMELINEETQVYIDRMRELYDSFNDSFPLTNDDISSLIVGTGNFDTGPVIDSTFLEDMKSFFKGIYDGLEERNKNKMNSVGSFFDYLTLGIPKSILDGNKIRGNEAFENPNWYTIGNWLTMGTFDMVADTVRPERPLSFEHWLNSFGTALMVLGIYRTLETNIATNNSIKNIYRSSNVGQVGKLTGSLDDLTPAERKMIDDLLNQGKDVEVIPRSNIQNVKTPDFLVDGIKTELKTLEGGSLNTPVSKIQRGFSQGAQTVIVDGRGRNLTMNQAQTVIDRINGVYDNKVPGKIEIWTNEGIIYGGN